MRFRTGPSLVICCVAAIIICYLTPPVSAFGAGNIVSVSAVSGKNWRHGDIEDTLLELLMSVSGGVKFDRMAVKRVYFGNWLRDYSQAIDVGALKKLPKDTIRVLLWVLSFVTFGFATGEFEVTEERLGSYRPEEHIDNPKDYADNEDARIYDPRLRGPVDEGKELAIDESNGMKVYIASENRGIDTSAGLVRKCFTRSIELGRQYARDGNKNDLYEALRLLGTGLHCLEDFAAHSNYVELALGELGVDAFPHVGQNCRVEANGKTLYPVVTGTFGMTDFVHSVVGEVSDKMTQSEVQALESKMDDACNQSQGGATSTLQKVLDNIPFGLLGLGDNSFGSQAERIQQNANAKELETKAKISDNKGFLDNEELKRQASQTLKEVYPILEFHDKVMKAMLQAIDKIPGAVELMETLTGALQIFIFSVLSPYIKPILEQVKVELAAGSTGILQASEKGQYIVWNDDDSSNPTHSMLSKDHFTNVLNEVAGRVASQIVRFAVPQIVECWEDEGRDLTHTINNILQVLHHPVLRNDDCEGQAAMFNVVRSWWEEKDEETKEHLREALSKEGVKQGKNHEGEDPIGGPGGRNHNHTSCAHGQGGYRERRQQGYNSGNQESQTGSYLGGNQQSSHGRDSYGRPEASGYGGRQEENQSSGGGSFGGLGGFLSNVASGNILGAAGALAGIAEQSGLVAEAKSGYERRNEQGSYEVPSYGRSEYSGPTEESQYSRYEQSSHGGEYKPSRNEGSSGNQASSYGVGYEPSRNEDAHYGDRYDSGSRNDDTSDSYSSRRHTEGGSGRQDYESSFGSFGRNQSSYERTSSYDQSSNYDVNRHNSQDSYGSRGYEGDSSYGRRRGDEGERESYEGEVHGSGRNDPSYGDASSYGQGSTYGGNRNNNQSSYPSGAYEEDSSYTGRSRTEEGREPYEGEEYGSRRRYGY